jgi:translation elongation factor EF-1alpha
MSRIVVLGHVDCGKSSLLGHLAKQLSEQGQVVRLPASRNGRVPTREWWMDLDRRSAEWGMNSFRYAWALDKTNEERERGLTLTMKAAYLSESGLILLDAPGHPDYQREQCKAASVADAALLIVSASEWNLARELSMAQKDVMGGGIDQACRVIRGYGICRVIVAVNKMDTARDAARFLEVQEAVQRRLTNWKISSMDSGYSLTTHREFPLPFQLRMHTLLLVARRLGIHLPQDIKVLLGRRLVACEGYGKVSFIPVSAWVGANLTEQSRSYREIYTGPTLYDALRALPSSTVDPVLAGRVRPRFQVLSFWQIRGVGPVVGVHVQRGILRRGMRCKVQYSDPAGVEEKFEFDVFDIHVQWAPAEVALAGTIATLHAKNLTGLVSRLRSGDSGGLADDDALHPAFAFEALIFPETRPVKLGSELHMNVQAARCTARIVRIVWSGKNDEASQSLAPAGQPAHVVCEVLNVRLAPVHELPKLPHFVWKQNGYCTGVGQVTAILANVRPSSRRWKARGVREVAQEPARK